MISSIKLFYLDGTAMVALYGGEQTGADDWQCNLPATEVIDGDPAALPAEQALPVATAGQLVSFTPAFQRRLKPPAPMLGVPELVQTISVSTDIPAPQVRKIVAALLQHLADLVEKGGRVDTPQLRIHSRTTAALAATDTTPARPERRFAVLMPRPQEQKQA